MVAAALVMAVVSGPVTSTPGAGAQTANPFQRGPAPTEANINAARGSFAISQVSVSDLSTPGFGAGTIYFPTDTSQGTFGAVAVAPGFTATQSSMAWLGPRLASQGFVIFTINTNSTFDFPASRGTQLLAALDYLVNTSSVRTRIDRNRLAVMGHSMGGGGSLEAASDRPSLQAAIPLAGWNSDKTWGEVQVPTLVVGAENDSVAPVSSHSIPFYNSLSGSLDKAYLELNNASHFAPNSSNTTIARYSIAWLKRFVDNDLRYEPFLCGSNHQSFLQGGTISDYRDTCPHS
jgi:predicted dienelactone hydrolase